MTVLVFGRTGQVATELQRQGNVRAVGRDEVDFSAPDRVRDFVRAARADVFVNAVAYTAVDKAETEEPLANAVNGASVGELARVAAERGIPLVHISTDYVFAGGGTRPWAPSDPTGPLGAYGRSKLIGEEAIRASGCIHAILRTSWVFSAHGANFVKTMLRLSETRDALNVVEDQIGGPTPAADIAAACLSIAAALRDDPAKSGTYHLSGQPDVSWKTFACEIFAQAGRDVAVTGIPTSAYPTPATRPLNSRMDCSSLTEAFGINRPDWRAGLAQVLADLEIQPV